MKNKMHKIILGKKGAEKTISVYWFAILVIVAGAVAYMVISVYGKPYDIRETESQILASTIADCISEGGYLQEKTLGDSAFQQDFLKRCDINLETPDFPGTKGEYYIEVSFYNFETGNKINFDIIEGNFNLKSGCELKGETQPACYQKSFYAIDKEQEKYKVNIISVVNKAGKCIINGRKYQKD
jgi:hypothetical protein